MAEERRRRVWVVVFEDQEGPGDPSVYPSKRAALDWVKELLEQVVADEFESIGSTPELEEILQDLKDDNVEGALRGWDYLDTGVKVHLSDGFYYPPTTAREW